jgi:hypothetical protein
VSTQYWDGPFWEHWIVLGRTKTFVDLSPEITLSKRPVLDWLLGLPVKSMEEEGFEELPMISRPHTWKGMDHLPLQFIRTHARC